MLWWIFGIIFLLLAIGVLAIIHSVASGKQKLISPGSIGLLVFHAGCGVLAIFFLMKAVKSGHKFPSPS